SSAAPSRLVARPPGDGYAPEHVNVVDQREDDQSLLQLIRRLITRYRGSHEIGWGEFEVLDTGETKVLAHSLRDDLGRMVAVHNFAPDPAMVALALPDEPEGTVLTDLIDARERMPIDKKGRVEFEIDAYGFGWWRMARPGDLRLS